jgi:MoxR-like ATPase
VSTVLPAFSTPLELEKRLRSASYIADARTSLTLFLALRLERPLLLEGPAGVGKTDLARAASEALGRPLLRLQCYEGLDEAKALYEWDYAKQMLYTQLLRGAVEKEIEGTSSIAEASDKLAASGAAFFSERFLLSRPVLQAIRSETPAVLLLDEIDRADPEFEAFLLEVLSEFQVTLPELGTIRAVHKPLVLLTTNGTREMTDALRRRCLHLFLDYPPPSREMEIVKLRVPGIEAALAQQVARFVEGVRKLDLRKSPSISEAIDWAQAIVTLSGSTITPELARQTLGVLLKFEEDREKVDQRADKLLQG